MSTPQPPWGPYGTPGQDPGYASPEYAPPQAEGPATTLKVFGILALVFSSLNAAGNALSIVQAAFSSSVTMPPPTSTATPSAIEMHEAIVDYTEAAMKVAAVQGGVMVLMDVALFTLGILLLQRREVARKGCIAWAAAAFVVLVGRAAAFEIVLWPKLRRFMDGMSEGFASAGGSGGPAGFFGLFTGFAHFGQYISLVAMAVFPICLLVFMNLASTKAQVRARV